MGEIPTKRPSDRLPKFDGGEISSVVRIQGTVIVLAGRVQGGSLHVLIDSHSTGYYLSARCQIVLELDVKPTEDFEWLTLADCLEVHAQG